jgi:hypothetical protein
VTQFRGCIDSTLLLQRDARLLDAKVRTADNEFWKAVDLWKLHHLQIVVTFTRTETPKLQEIFTGRVIGSNGRLVSFHDETTGKELTLDFAEADVFIGGFEVVEPFGMVRVIEVAWQNAEFLNCTLMEPRETRVEN